MLSKNREGERGSKVLRMDTVISFNEASLKSTKELRKTNYLETSYSHSYVQKSFEP